MANDKQEFYSVGWACELLQIPPHDLHRLMREHDLQFALTLDSARYMTAATFSELQYLKNTGALEA